MNCSGLVRAAEKERTHDQAERSTCSYVCNSGEEWENICMNSVAQYLWRVRMMLYSVRRNVSCVFVILVLAYHLRFI